MSSDVGGQHPQHPQHLSASWRTVHSNYQPVELAHALKAIGKVVGHVVTRPGVEVEYTTKHVEDKDPLTGVRRVLVNPAWMMHETPVAPGNFDVATGMAIHQAIRIQAGTDEVYDMVHTTPQWGEIPITKLGEELFAHYVTSTHSPVLHQYWEKALDAHNVDEINWDSVKDIVRQIYLFNNTPDSGRLIASNYIGVLSVMSGMVVGLKDIAENLGELRRVYNTFRIRRELYVEIYNKLKELHKEFEANEKQIQQVKEQLEKAGINTDAVSEHKPLPSLEDVPVKGGKGEESTEVKGAEGDEEYEDEDEEENGGG